jgi:hypothetical protein
MVRIHVLCTIFCKLFLDNGPFFIYGIEYVGVGPLFQKGTCKKLPSVGIYNVHYEILILDF